MEQSVSDEETSSASTSEASVICGGSAAELAKDIVGCIQSRIGLEMTQLSYMTGRNSFCMEKEKYI